MRQKSTTVPQQIEVLVMQTFQKVEYKTTVTLTEKKKKCNRLVEEFAV